MIRPNRLNVGGSAPSVRESFERMHGVIVAGAIAASTILAYRCRFLQDDAFISFRYADNLARGIGLVFNEGERVEGFTNFLWTLLLALGIRLGASPEWLAQAMGLACFPGTLFLAYAMGRRVVGGRWVPLLVVLLLGTNYSFLAYGTGGLETQSQALLVTATAYLAIGLDGDASFPTRTLLAFSTLAALALLTRLDSAVLITPPLVAVAVRVYGARESAARTTLLRLAALAGPLLVIMIAYLAFKLSYYGAILPNTLAAKTGLPLQRRIANGVSYVLGFVEAYWMVAGLAAVAVKAYSWRRDRVRLPLVASLVCWSLYLLWAGGDFMEFRLVVPALPLLVVLVVDALGSLVKSRLGLVALVLPIPFGSYRHHERTRFVRGVPNAYGVETIESLTAHVGSFNQDWRAVGRALAATFGDRSVTIAVPCAGAIPYYSRLRTVDMMGLNDAWVAKNGVSTSDLGFTLPLGHTKWAPGSYLLERGVNLLVAPLEGTHPLARATSYSRTSARFLGWVGELPDDARVLRLPVDGGHEVPMLYVVPSPAVERAIAERKVKVFTIER